eukprot:scaffold16694_cov125-Isochrysis_galbana.AAC.2
MTPVCSMIPPILARMLSSSSLSSAGRIFVVSFLRFGTCRTPPGRRLSDPHFAVRVTAARNSGSSSKSSGSAFFTMTRAHCRTTISGVMRSVPRTGPSTAKRTRSLWSPCRMRPLARPSVLPAEPPRLPAWPSRQPRAPEIPPAQPHTSPSTRRWARTSGRCAGAARHRYGCCGCVRGLPQRSGRRRGTAVLISWAPCP